MVCFYIISMENEPSTSQKLCTMHDHAVKSELSHGYHGIMMQNTENGFQKYRDLRLFVLKLAMCNKGSH